MAIIIYHKETLIPRGTVAKFSLINDEIKRNVFPNFGGAEEDYDFIEVPYTYFKLERVNGEVIVIEDNPPLIPDPDPQPSKEDLMGMELTKMKLENFQKTQIINQLGQDLTKVKIDIIQLKGGM